MTEEAIMERLLENMSRILIICLFRQILEEKEDTRQEYQFQFYILRTEILQHNRRFFSIAYKNLLEKRNID